MCAYVYAFVCVLQIVTSSLSRFLFIETQKKRRKLTHTYTHILLPLVTRKKMHRSNREAIHTDQLHEKYPYLAPRSRDLTIVEKIRGSYVVIALPYTLLFTLTYISIYWLDQWQPFIQSLNGYFLSAMTFGVTMTISAKYARGDNRFLQAWQLFRNFGNAVTSYATELSSALSNRSLGRREIETVAEINDLLRSMAYAVKHSFRGAVNLNSLPMSEKLKEKVVQYGNVVASRYTSGGPSERQVVAETRKNAISAMNFLISQNLHSLSSDKSELLSDGKMLRLSNLQGEWVGTEGAIGHLLYIPYPSQFYNLMLSFVVLYLLIIGPFFMLNYGFWLGIVVNGALTTMISGFVLVGDKVDNIFKQPSRNVYNTAITVGQVSNDIARSVDASFNQVLYNAV